MDTRKRRLRSDLPFRSWILQRNRKRRQKEAEEIPLDQLKSGE